MNIVIVSKDSYFISGMINLISDAWVPGIDSPVFLVADEYKSLLVPDIVITDVSKTTSIFGHRKRSGSILAEDNVTERYVSLFMAAQCHDESSSCSQHLIPLKKGESAERIHKLFKRSNAFGYAKKIPNAAHNCRPHDAILLSKQQAMVVKYTRLGLSLTDISRITSLSIKTISTHKRAVMRKLDMKNNSDFYRYALVGFTPR